MIFFMKYSEAACFGIAILVDDRNQNPAKIIRTRRISNDDILCRLCRINAYEQHLRMECGKAPAHSSAPVVSNQMEPTIRNMLNDL